MKRLLFITWDGPQVNYLEGLFAPILSGLCIEYQIHVVQFTWGDTEKSERIKRELGSRGISYERLNVSLRSIAPVGILLTLLRGSLFLRAYLQRNHIDLVMFRSTYPSILVFPWMKGKYQWIFDADGLPLEEKVDFAHLNPRGFSFRWMKWIEKRAIEKSDGVLLRSMKARYALPPETGTFKYYVVKNGRDPKRFRVLRPTERAALREGLGFGEDELVLAYCGSLGEQYCVREMVYIMERIQTCRKARLLILTGSPEYIENLELGALKDHLTVLNVPYEEVASYLGASDAGLAIRKSAPSMQAVAPIKLGEYLLCGLPVLASPGIGDTEEMLFCEKACLILKDHSPAALDLGANWLCTVAGDSSIRESARTIGLAKFSLESSILSYRTALNGLH